MDVGMTSAISGLQRAEGTLNRAAAAASRVGAAVKATEAGDVVDLSQLAVDLMTAKHAYTANLTVIEAIGEVQNAAVRIVE